MSLLQRIENQAIPLSSVSEGTLAERKAAREGMKDQLADLKIRVHKEIIDNVEKDLIQKGPHQDKELADRVGKMVEAILDRDAGFLPYSERQRLTADMLDEVLGLGPIEPLIRDPDVSEIMVNGPFQVYVERKGKLEQTNVKFRDENHVMHVIERIVAPIGRRIDESSPMVDARLQDGSRVNAIIPPLSLTGPVITIRKFSRDPLKMSDLIRFGTLTTGISRLLEAAVKARLNIVVSGGTGSGKTTTLNVLSACIPETERIVTIEDAAELQLRQEHLVILETRPPNIEGKGMISMRDLVRNALRMRPDRIIVGEVRSGEALDMLQAMNTGHDGSMTTGHANTPRDILARLETMVMMAGMDLPIRAIREQISSAINLIVQQSRLKDGSRRITHVTEVLGMEGDTIVLQDIFRFEQTGVDIKGGIVGQHQPTGVVPTFLEKLETEGINLPRNLFLP